MESRCDEWGQDLLTHIISFASDRPDAILEEPSEEVVPLRERFVHSSARRRLPIVHLNHRTRP